jgi:DNA-directed RNA polymerase subunit RPC12/RpoP
MYKCSKCDKEFELKSSKSNHEKWCDGTKRKRKIPFICPKCGYEIKTSRKLHVNSCDGYGTRRNNNPNRPKGNGRGWSKGKTYEEIYGDRAELIKEKLKNNPNFTGRALTPDTETERKRKISETMKRKKLGGYRKGSGRGKQGRYKGIWCDSSWELAWVIYQLDNNVSFERNWKKFDYVFNGENKSYSPDFKIGKEYIEIKGYLTEQAIAKFDQFPEKIKMVGEKKMLPIIKWVKEKYGDDFISLYEK